MNISLRPWKMSDLNDLVRQADNPKIAENLMDRFPSPYSRNDGIKFIEMNMSKDPAEVLAIDLNGIAIGAIGIHPQPDIYRKNAELGYWLAEEYWGQGIISMIIPMMVEYAFKNFNITRIYARPFGRNMASRRVLEKSGFNLETVLENTIYKNGVYENEYIFAIRHNQGGN